MAIVATGGYGRGAARPVLRHRSVVPAPLQADAVGRERRRVHALRAVGPGLQGRARDAHDRSVHQARHRDITIRTSLLDARLIHGDAQLYADFEQRFRTEVVEGTARALHRRQDGRARCAPSGSGREPLQGRAQHQGRQGRPARSAHAALALEIPLRPGRGRGDGCRRHLQAGRGRHLPPLRGLPLDHPLLPALLQRPRRGGALVRRAAVARRAAQLPQPRRPARGRALHEALFPRREGRRRPDHDPVLGARDAAAQDVAGPEPAVAPAQLEGAAPAPHAHRFPHRQRSLERRRPGRVQARSGEPHPLLRRGEPDERVPAPGRDPAAAPVAAPDRRQAARRPGGEPHFRRAAEPAKPAPRCRCGA